MISQRNRRTLIWSLSCSAALLAVWALLPTRSSNAADPPAAAATVAATKVVATVGGQAVSQADVEARVVQRVLERQPQMLEAALGELIQEKLLALEAASRNMTTEQLVAAEVAGKAPAPSDAEIEQFYEENKARVPANVTKEQVIPQIRTFLQNQRNEAASEALFAALRSKYEVANHLEREKLAVERQRAQAIRARLETGGVSKGAATAPVVLVEFSDFQCPFCARVVPTLQQLSGKYGDKLRIVFRQFPLNEIHPEAQKAAEASLCAAEQGKFWELHDLMFVDVKALGVAQLKAKAAGIGLDTAKFNECVDSGRMAAAVAADMELGRAVGVTGTPAIYVNGRTVAGGAATVDALSKMIDEELAGAASAK